MIGRREFITLLGAAAAWPLAARAQQSDRMRRIGIITTFNENNFEAKAYLSAFTHGLTELGWTPDRNLRMDIRWTGGSVDRMRAYAKELVDLQPEVILAESTPPTAMLQRETRTIPIVFVQVSDPIGSGFVASLSRPGGNLTGFMIHETSMGGKWLELLTEVAPAVRRAAAMFNPETAPYVPSFYLPSFEAAARSLKIEPIVAQVHSDTEIQMLLTSLGGEPGSGLIALPDSYSINHAAQIALLAARNNIPAVYFNGSLARAGGLLSYAADSQDIFRRAAVYVSRILHGEKPAVLPVQLPVRFVMTLNVGAAKGLGLMVPPSILLRADEVIE
jgi:putative ABC transport system substrate-binding protein